MPYYKTEVCGAYTQAPPLIPDQDSWLEQLFSATPIVLPETTETVEQHLRYKTTVSATAANISPTQRAVKRNILALIEAATDHSYNTFFIPKATGGLRQIDAPNEHLKEKMRLVKKDIENVLNLHPHDAAHAYVKQRSVLTALQVHQKNQSNWFLKLDLKDFFPAHTEDYTMQQLNQLWLKDALPIPELVTFASYNGGLPQGTPLSPLLTNLCMTPIDYKITQALSSAYRYTRYADDLLISSRVDFAPEPIIRQIENVLRTEGCPFTINAAKTRYGSAARRNWNLGLMYNKDKAITLGHQKKQRLRAAINNFLRDFTNGILWTTMDVQHLQGLLAYFKHIEPAYALYVFNEYSTKYNCELKHAIKTCLNN